MESRPRSDVWIGSYRNPIKAKGANFAGPLLRHSLGLWVTMRDDGYRRCGDRKGVRATPLADKNSLWVPLDNLERHGN